MFYGFGSNGSAQLGVGHADDLSSPQRIVLGNDQKPFKVRHLAAGGNHTIILCDDGRVLATGNNGDGRCGIKVLQQIDRFEQLDLPHDPTGTQLQVKHFSANWSVTTFVFSDGTVRTCGTGNSGELGLGSNSTNASTLQTLAAFPPCETHVVHLSSGMAHTIAILSNGEVYGWGKGRKGQIGEPAMDVWTPRKVDGLNFKAVKAICGKDFTLIAGDPSSGDLALLGPKGADRFGLKDGTSETLTGWKDIAASWGSIFMLNDRGGLVGWGRNDHGQLPPKGIPVLESIAAGSEHCVGLTKDGQVLVWGWGEHGNCGTPTDERGDVNGRWNGIGVPGRATKVYAGCATSFIETEADVG